mmetsp:Transcript_42465/g.102285  ORF Transcript_42465/g.102285 Transcript_42465/m.102285 type:complete len:730 (+) Transcript_42465:151-2340(+)
MTTAWESLGKLDDGEDVKKFILNFGYTPAAYNAADEAIRNNMLGVYRSQQQGEGTNKKRRVGEGEGPDLIEFKGEIKKCLGIGDLCKKFGGLLDRESSKKDLTAALVGVAKRVGKKVLDKKDVPVLGLAAPSGSGKTEFLRWIFNNCCTYVSSDDNTSDNKRFATSLLEEINQAIPETQEKLQEILVLFASFNQTSTYMEGEGPVLSTTVERLLRSFHGNVTMGGDNEYNRTRYDGFASLEDIMNHFSSREDKGKTGFIFCIDELSKLKKEKIIIDDKGRRNIEVDNEVFQRLLDGLLQASQSWLSGGGFCVIVGAGLSMYDLGDVVLQLSARAYAPIQFPTKRPEMAKRAIIYAQQNTDVFSGSEASNEVENFYLDVTTSMLESNMKLDYWADIMDLKSTDTRVRPNLRPYRLPEAFTYDEIFVLVAQAIFNEGKWRNLERPKVEALLNKLGGSVILKPMEGDKFTTEVQELEKGQMVLPAWRLLELSANDEKGKPQLFTWVQDWVLIETRKLLYTYGQTEVGKMWEIATMGVMELRRALLFSIEMTEHADDENWLMPTLQQILDGLDVHHNVNDILMQSVASPEPASNAYCRLQKIESAITSPIILYSSLQNEEGIEGIFRGGFDSTDHEEVCMVFQMKLYEVATARQILNWLRKANERAKELGLEDGSYVVQLFVTGTIDDNICEHKDHWPDNCMVFGTKALEALFEPFGNGFINEVIRLRKRKQT